MVKLSLVTLQGVTTIGKHWFKQLILTWRHQTNAMNLIDNARVLCLYVHKPKMFYQTLMWWMHIYQLQASNTAYQALLGIFSLPQSVCLLQNSKKTEVLWHLKSLTTRPMLNNLFRLTTEQRSITGCFCRIPFTKGQWCWKHTVISLSEKQQCYRVGFPCFYQHIDPHSFIYATSCWPSRQWNDLCRQMLWKYDSYRKNVVNRTSCAIHMIWQWVKSKFSYMTGREYRRE